MMMLVMLCYDLGSVACAASMGIDSVAYGGYCMSSWSVSIHAGEMTAPFCPHDLSLALSHFKLSSRLGDRHHVGPSFREHHLAFSMCSFREAGI